MDTPNDTTIPLTRGFFAIVDSIDSDLLQFNWNAKQDNRNVYATRSKKVDGKTKTILMHRIILGRKLGRELEPKEKVDHWDGNGLNNKRENLRLASSSQNAQNKRKSINKGLPKGVSKLGNRYQVYIMINGKNTYIGLYKTPEIAGEAYKAAAIKHFKEFARY